MSRHIKPTLLAVLMISALAPRFSNAGILYVNASAAPAGNGASWATAYQHLQSALANATANDQIWVASGTYMPDGGYTPLVGSHVNGSGDRNATFQLIDGVTIYGGFDGTETLLTQRQIAANTAVLSGDLHADDGALPDSGNPPAAWGNNSFTVVSATGLANSAILDGFTITHGNAIQGGGVRRDTGDARVRNCIVRDNYASNRGAGMSANGGSTVSVDGCQFIHNRTGASGFSGSGLYIDTTNGAFVTNCNFTNNIAAFAGGGMWFSCPVTARITDCTFTGNNAGPGNGQGGGLDCEFSDPLITRCTFIANAAQHYGAGIYNAGGSPTLTNCRFVGNVVGYPGGSGFGWGGGMYNNNGGGGHEGNARLINCSFSGNTATGLGGGLYTSGSFPVMTNCSFTTNACLGTGETGSLPPGFGGGIWCAGTPTIKNVILWGNTALNAGPQIYAYTATPTVTFCDMQGGFTGDVFSIMHATLSNNIDADPLFRDATGPDNLVGTDDDDLRLLEGSPCIDAGENAAVPADVVDLDGDANTAEPTPLDLGGYIRFRDDPLISDSGSGSAPIVDMGAYEAFSDCNNNGVPDEQESPGCSTWAAANNLWGTAANWNPPQVPNNGGGQEFAVTILGSSANVSLNINATINALRLIPPVPSLHIDNGDLTIASAAGIVNNGELTVGAGHAIIAAFPAGPVRLAGSMPIKLAGASAMITSLISGDAVKNSGVISGQGIIDANFINDGRVRADVPRSTTLAGTDAYRADVSDAVLDITGSNTKINNGLFEAINDGILQISCATLTGTGAYRASDGGTISIPGTAAVIVVGTTLDVLAGGTAQINSNSNVNVNHVHLTCSSSLRGCIPPVLNCAAGSAPGSGLHVSGNMQVQGPATVSISSTADVSVGGNFDNQCDSPSTFDWAMGPLRLDGASPQFFELAGADLGPRNPAGFTSNFAMNLVRVEPGRTIDFANAFDNSGTGGCEALYVHTLSLGAASTIILHGCDVYYDTLVRESGAVVILQGGASLMSTHAGDLDGDNQVTLADVNQLTSVLLGGTCNASCMALADLNGDGLINGADISVMVRVLIGW